MASETGYYGQVDVPEPGAGDIEIETADLYEVLRNQRRRFLILLVDRFGRISLSEAADRIAAFEVDGRVDSQARKAVYVGLYQSHGEKVAESGLVEFDDRSKEFYRSPLTGTAAGYIRDGYERFACFEGASEVLR